MPSICFISSTDTKNSAYKEELARDLLREGITVAPSLIDCQVMILLQSIEAAQSPQVKMLLASAQLLISQQQREESVRSAYEDFLQAKKMALSPYVQALLTSSQETPRRPMQSIVRFVYENIELLPAGWDTLTAIDATEDRAAATKQLASFILHPPKITIPSMQIVQPSNNRTVLPTSVLPPPLDNPGLQSQPHTSEQFKVSITSALKQAERYKSIEENGSKQVTRSLEPSKSEQGELDHPIESQADTSTLPPTEEKPASEDLANPFEDDEVSTTTVMPAIVQIKNKPDTQPPLVKKEAQIINQPDMQSPATKAEVRVTHEPDTQSPATKAKVQIKHKPDTQPPLPQKGVQIKIEPDALPPVAKKGVRVIHEPDALPPVAKVEKKAIRPSSAVQPTPPAQTQISRSQQPVREAKAHVSPEPRPSSPSPAPQLPEPSQPVKLKHDAPRSSLQQWWPLAVIFIVLLIALLAMPSLRTQKPQQVASSAPVAQVVGYAYLFSSGITNANNTTGVNDGLQIDLTHITPPASGTQYYGWLLPDLNQTGGTPVSLGVLPVQGGAIKVSFISPTNSDLLAQTSQFLITQESAALTPSVPSSNHSAWRYYAQLPQQPGAATMDMMHLSFLDHLRHLLVEDPDLASVQAHGGISLWTKDNTRKVLEWANAARGSGVPQASDVTHRQFIRILDYLDGVSYVKQDLPAKSPFLADQVGGHFGLLTIRANANPSGYLQQMDMHLQEMVSSPGTTSSERALAKQIDAALAQVQTNLQQARQDSIKLVNTPTASLKSKASINLLADLVEQVNDSYTGQYDPQTGARTQGITWVCDQLQHLATYEVETYIPGQAPTQIPTQPQMTSNSKM